VCPDTSSSRIAGVRCPFCSFDSTRVVDSRLTEPGDAIRRRRECAGCGNRFTTYERAEELPIVVVKRDGRRERFDRQKLLRGLVRAANKRPVSDEQLEALADSIASEVRRGGPETPAEQVGELALRGLASLDPVTAILFASVYRSFTNLGELEAEVRRIEREPVLGADQLALEASSGGPDPSDRRTSIGRSPSKGSDRAADKRRAHVRQS
jgi:transcriptional repressor NrdR